MRAPSKKRLSHARSDAAHVYRRGEKKMKAKASPSVSQGEATVSVEVANAFIGSTQVPTDLDLDRALGHSKAAWDELIADLADQHDVTIQEWRSYSPKAGWSLRLKRGKRTIVWLSPCEGCFEVLFILGDKALLAARQSDLSARAMEALEKAIRYPEGTGVRLLMKTSKDIPAVKKLAAAKLAN